MNLADHSYEEFTEAEYENASGRKSSFNYPVSNSPVLYSSQVLKVLGAIEFGNYKDIEPLVLSPAFMHENQNLVLNGELIHKALSRNLIEFISRLEKAGYVIPDNLLLKAIKQQKLEMISSIISATLYNTRSAQLELWYLLYKNLPQYAEILKNNEPYLNENYYVLDFNNERLCNDAMKKALERKFDNFATKILKICPQAVDLEMIEIAIENDNFEFIRRIWTGHISDLQKDRLKKRRNLKAVVWKTLNLEDNFSRKVTAKKYLDIGYIIKRLLQKKLYDEAKKVIMWPEAADDNQILNICIELNQEDLARDVMKYRKKEIKKGDFELGFNKGFYWLCLDMLQSKEAKSVLLNQKVQEKIVELLSDGLTCYFAAEFLNAINLKFWTFSLIPIVNQKLLHLIRKSETFVKCPFPLLFITLMCEFFKKLAQKTLHYQKVCNLLVSQLLKLAIHIQDTITEEEDLRLFLQPTDTRKRSVLSIIAENGFYCLLENNDLGSIISRMWGGDLKAEGLLSASTLYNSFRAPSSSSKKLMFLNPPTEEKFYTFQYEQLTSSCQLRFLGQTLSTLLLVYFYTQMIYTATLNNSMNDVSANENSVGLLRISQVWVFALFSERIIHYVFCVMTRRHFVVDFWIFNDLVISLMTILIMTGANVKYTGSGNVLSFVGSTDLNIVMYGFTLCLIWLRFFKVLQTSDTYGPILMIILTMSKEMIQFLIVFFSTIFISAVSMTSIFNKFTTTGKFSNFGESLTTILSTSLGSFDLSTYSKYIAFGGIYEGFLVIILNILLLNILIAILGVAYEKERMIQTSKFRAVLVESYNKWKWDEKYGILILLPPPLSILSIIILPFIAFSNNPEKITGIFARFIFLFYAIPFFLVFCAVSLLFVPVIYFTCLVEFAKGGRKKLKKREIFVKFNGDEDGDEEEDDDEYEAGKADGAHVKVFSYRRAIVWILIGWIFALVAYFRDCLQFWRIIFNKPQKKFTAQDILINSKFVENALEAIKRNPGFIINFDDFLQSFNSLDSQSLSSIFKSDTRKVSERQKIFSRFFKNFLYSRKNKIIRSEFLRAFIKKNNHYGSEYFIMIKAIRVHLIIKALRKYKKNYKETSIKNIKLPKHLISGGTFQVKHVLVSAKELLAHQKAVIDLNFKNPNHL